MYKEASFTTSFKKRLIVRYLFGFIKLKYIHLGRTEFKGEVDSQQISQWDSSNYALKLVES